MQFRVAPEVFELLPDACFGIVVARGVRQGNPDSPTATAARRYLEEAMEESRARFGGSDCKNAQEILPYREAFRKLGINPNRFLSSVEAMVSRIAKGGQLPSINTAVDLANSVGLRFAVPLGVHDLDRCCGDVEVRLSRPGDLFTPFGQTEQEAVETGEVVYADGAEVRTRRWIWRQGEYSKSTPESETLFCPIDGFSDRNLPQVLGARGRLASLLREVTGAYVNEFFADRAQPSVTLD